MFQFSHCHVRLFVTPWIAACQASLSLTNSRSSLRLMSIESVIPSSHLILCRPLLLLPPVPISTSIYTSLIAQLVKNPTAIQEILVRFLGWEGPLEKGILTPVFLGFPGDWIGKESVCNAGDLGWIPGLGRSLGEGHGNPLRILAWRIPMDRRAWRTAVHGVTKSPTGLSD